MPRYAPVVLATLLAAIAPACAQAHPATDHAPATTPFTVPPAAGRFTDPANLAGERVRPRDGRELPIDGGLNASGEPDNALGLQQMLRKLATRASLMLIVAHPDDEDGGLLTLYSRGLGARVAILTLNRGEGGQNQMTGDFEDALGLIRTQELLSADRYMGVDTQMFGTEVDFGFSKTKAEAFAKWNHQRVLYDAVRAVRIFRPLVIASVFMGAVTDGHGQHQVAGEIAQEVFKAAGDPTVFPELTREGILPWQPLKVYARVPFSPVTAQGLYDYATGQFVPAEFTNYVTGQTFTHEPTADVTVHEGDTDPLLSTCAANPADLPAAMRSADCRPLSYAQFARIGLGLQRTQIGAAMRVPPAGRVDVGYHLYGSMVKGNATHSGSGFFKGIDTSLDGILTLAPDVPASLRSQMTQLSAMLTAASTQFDPQHPANTAPVLADAAVKLDHIVEDVDRLGLPEDARQSLRHELLVKRAQLDDALALALGLNADATATGPDVDTGTPVKITTRIAETSPLELSVKDVDASIGNQGRSNPQESKRDDRPLTQDHADQRTLTVPANETQTPTRPYFFRKNIEEPVYQLLVPDLRNAAATPPAITVWTHLDYRGVDVTVGRVLHTGDQPLRLIPPVNLMLAEHAQVLLLSSRQLQTRAEVQAAADVLPKATLQLSMPAGWHVDPATSPLKVGETAIKLGPAPGITQPATLSALARTRANDHIHEGFRPVGYGTLPRTNYYTPATDRIVPVDLTLPPANQRRIAYLPGTGDAVPQALASIGLAPTILTVADLTAASLARFDTVILGVRTYNAHPDLHGAPTQALLDYARNGGNVVVQYQTPEFTGADAPYPLEDRNERVVDETTPVEILDPSSPLLTTPNRITAADFNGWIEERGHGFLDSWSHHYTVLTETHDPGQPSEHIVPQAPQRGGLITVQLGRGRWTYCAFALYRQLPEAVPGAFRLFVNLLTP